MDHKLQVILAAKDITGTAFTKFKSSLGAITKSVFSLNTVIGTLAGSAGIGYLVKSSLQAADAIGKAADVAGINTAALQEYQHAANLSGVSTELLNNSFLAFNKRLGEAKAGTGALVTYLKKNDQALLENIRRAGSTEKALQLVFDRMGSLANASDRAALAAAAFSRSGVKLTVMTKAGAAGLENMREEARALGLVIDDDLIRNAETANDKLDTLGRVLKTQVTATIVELAPKISEISTDILEWIKNNQVLISQNIQGTFDAIATSLGAVADAYKRIDDFLSFDEPDSYLAAHKDQLENTLERQQKQLDMLKRLGSEGSNAYETLIRRISLTKESLKMVTAELAAQNKFITGGGFGGAPTGKKIGGDGNDTLPAIGPKPKPEPSIPIDYSFLGRTDSAYRMSRAGGVVAQMGSIEAAQAAALERMTANNELAYDAMDAHVSAYYDNLEAQQERSAAAIDYFADRMSTAFADFVTTGKFSFKDFSNSIINDLIRIQSRAMLTGLFSSIGGVTGGFSLAGLFGDAAGGVYGPMGRMAFASGGVIDRPTVFPFAGGVGLMGESGPEAIMPLRRGPSGRLGVEGSGGSAPVVNNYYITAMDAQSMIDHLRRSGAVPMLAAENLNANGILRQAMSENR